jgi:hypothetical protein
MGNVVSIRSGLYGSFPLERESRSVKEADDLRIVLGCLLLVRKKYKEEGYSFGYLDVIKSLVSKRKTKVFYIPKGERVSSTISVFPDLKKEGLPLDAIYHNEAETLRAEGKVIAEVGKFASIGGAASGPFSEIWDLMKRVLGYSAENRIDTLCITVNPKHRLVYRFIGFIPVGDIKNHPKVKAPAVLMIAGTERLRKNKHYRSSPFG